MGRALLGLLGWLALTALAAYAGAVATTHAPSFYGSLDRPAWAPPSGIFGPVWTVLYIMMALAAWLVWRARGLAGNRALALFVVQLGLNALWSWLFFRWRAGALAFAEILILWAAIAATILEFRRVREAAAALLLPYLAWVTFAAALTWSVWRRNPGLL